MFFNSKIFVQGNMYEGLHELAYSTSVQWKMYIVDDALSFHVHVQYVCSDYTSTPEIDSPYIGLEV